MGNTPKLTGLLLGAGASYELGMPLVTDLTAELKAWLTPAKLRELNEGWRVQGGGHPDAVIDDLATWLELPNAHYESILGHLETQFRRHSLLQQEYHALYSWLVETVYHILYFRHTLNVHFLKMNLHYIEGLTHLVAANSPLWIFSLNHDLIIECFAAMYGIPVNSGFGPDTILVPRRNTSGVKTGDLKVETISEAQLEKGLPFLQPGLPGMNLLKIHGALDVFAFNDGKDLMKLTPLEPTVAGVIGALRAANEELLFIDPGQPHPVKSTNEITYADEAGVMQFLRRSLLAGAYKFDNRRSQVLPHRMLRHFQSNLNYLSTLVCIGYGFGDDHINQIIRQWLEFSADRQLEIVSPGIKSVPASLLHLATQVTLTASTATDYLDQKAGIVRSGRDALDKRLATWIRKQPDKQKAKEAFAMFVQENTQKRTTAFIAELAKFPLRDGNIDFEAAGMTAQQFADKCAADSGDSIEDLMKAFLDSHP